MSDRQCICHVADASGEDEIFLFSEITWQNLLSCAEVWQGVDGSEQRVARNLLQNLDYNFCSSHDQLHDVGYHRKCYQK